MKKLTFGTPEEHVPSRYCLHFTYTETDITYPTEKIVAQAQKRGYTLLLPLQKDEQIFGFGLQLKRFAWRGGKATIRTNADPTGASGDSHAPVPFFVSTAGYGIFVDTLRYAEFYIDRTLLGGTVEDSGRTADSTEELYRARYAQSESQIAIQIPAAAGVDIYIIEGKTITDIVAQYNMLAGGGCTVPDWGLGVFYRCYGKYNEDQVLSLARYFREKDIPCDVLGLEPGWQTHTYSCSYRWSEAFPHPAQMLDALQKMGYHVNLWEHAFTHPSAPFYEEIAPYCGSFDVWGGHTPDFSLPQARKIFADYHKKEIIQSCIDGFKLDECDNSDYTGGWSFPNMSLFPSGMDGEQYHSLFGTVYMQAMLEALDGTPTLSQVRQAGALAASYPFVLYSDLYAHRDFIRGVVTSGFAGLLWSPEVRHAVSKKDLLRRMQSTVFSVQCLINAWYCPDVPWKELDCEDEVRELFRLRENLRPRLKAAFEKYHTTGVPPVRALVMDYTDDPETYGIDDEYLFCEDLLVAPIIGTESDSREVYLPQGRWVDFFTDEPVEAGHFTVTTDGIPVYRRV